MPGHRSLPSLTPLCPSCDGHSKKTPRGAGRPRCSAQRPAHGSSGCHPMAQTLSPATSLTADPGVHALPGQNALCGQTDGIHASRETNVMCGEQGVKEGCFSGRRRPSPSREHFRKDVSSRPAPRGPPPQLQESRAQPHRRKEQDLPLRGTGSGLAVALDNCRGG